MQVHRACVGIQLPCAKVVRLISLRDANNNIVSGVGGRGSDAEDLSRDDNVGLEAKVIVSDSQRRGLALQIAGTADSLTASTRTEGKVNEAIVVI